MIYKPYTPYDADALCGLFKDTFSDSEGVDEGQALESLVRTLIQTTAPDDLVIYAAFEDDTLVGALILTPLWFSGDSQVRLLSPVAVKTSHHKRGIGQTLINTAAEALKAQGVDLIMTYGDINFYSKAGFQAVEEATLRAPMPLSYPHGWIARPLNGSTPPTLTDQPQCVTAFNDPDLW